MRKKKSVSSLGEGEPGGLNWFYWKKKDQLTSFGDVCSPAQNQLVVGKEAQTWGEGKGVINLRKTRNSSRSCDLLRKIEVLKKEEEGAPD